MKGNTFRSNLFLFLILIIFVGFLQYSLVGMILNFGFTPDDWSLLLFYKSLGDDPLSKLPFVWSIKGAYTTGQVYFIGILNNFFSLNYQAYHMTNIILKTLATLSLFPLILIIFKSRLLAFLTTILYGMSYMGSRSLEYVVKGADYLAIIPMNIFLIIYYLIVKERLKGLIWFVLMGIFWFVALMISPIRIYPILALIPLIEVYLLIQNRSLKNAADSVKRLLVLYLPFLLIYLYKPSSILSFLQSNPKLTYQAILNGNWHLILTPFQGVGLTLLTNEFWAKFLNEVNLAGLGSFLSFLLGNPLVIFGSITLVLSILKSRKPVKFLYRTFFATLILNIIFYYVAIHELNIAEGLRLHFDPARMYPVVISGFMLALSLASFLEWRDSGKKDNLLLVLWISPPIILLYTFLIWLFAPFGVGFEGQQGYYLVIPAAVTSLFLSAIFVTILNGVLGLKKMLITVIITLVIIGMMYYLYSSNGNEIFSQFDSAGANGRYALIQDSMYNQVVYSLGDKLGSEPTLFYFDVSGDLDRTNYYYEQGLFLNLPIRILLRNNKLNDGCIGTSYQGLESLAKLAVVKDNIRGFLYEGTCIKNGKPVVEHIGDKIRGLFFKSDNFYAFGIKNRQLFDIRKNILDGLEFNKTIY